MLGKMIGAIVGGNVAQNTRGISGTTGAVVGAAIPAIIARMSIPTMIAMGIGGYAVKKYMDRKDAGPTPGKNAPLATGKAPSEPKKIPEPA